MVDERLDLLIGRNSDSCPARDQTRPRPFRVPSIIQNGNPLLTPTSERVVAALYQVSQDTIQT